MRGVDCLIVLLVIGLALSQDMVSHMEINAIWSQHESVSMSLAVMRAPIHANVVVEDTEEIGLHQRPHRAPATTQHTGVIINWPEQLCIPQLLSVFLFHLDDAKTIFGV